MTVSASNFAKLEYNQNKPLVIVRPGEIKVIDSKRPIRILTAKPGLDGHDRGLNIITMAFRNAGVEVIYGGIRQTPQSLASAAIQEDVDFIAISSMSGALVHFIGDLSNELKRQHAERIKVIVGGITKDDGPYLKKLGVAGIFDPNIDKDVLTKAVDFLQQWADKNVNDQAMVTKITDVFDGDRVAADKEIDRLLASMLERNPKANREQALERLAWEYQAREVESVFPGINWKFMITNVHSKRVPIIILDWEDAVGTELKDTAREVGVIFVRAFKGEKISKTDLQTIQRKAELANDAKMTDGKVHPMIDFFDEVKGDTSEETAYILKKEYQLTENQMLGIRPNNLRTRWSAKDYLAIKSVIHLIDHVFIAKPDDDRDIPIVAGLLRQFQEEAKVVTGKQKIFVLGETVYSMFSLDQIFGVAHEVDEINLGVADLTAEMELRNSALDNPYIFFRSEIIWLLEAAQRAGRVAGMGATFPTTSTEKAREETRKAKIIGFHRKWGISPQGLDGVSEYQGQFPLVRRKFAEDNIGPLKLDLETSAANSQPIVKPEKFQRYDVILSRAVVTASSSQQENVKKALSSKADMVVVNIDDSQGLSVLGNQLREISRPNQIRLAHITAATTKAEIRSILEQIGDQIYGFMITDVLEAQQVEIINVFLSQLEQSLGKKEGTYKLALSFNDPEVIESQAQKMAQRDPNVILTKSKRIAWAFLDLPQSTSKEDVTSRTRGYYYYHSLFKRMTVRGQKLLGHSVDAIDGLSSDENLKEETNLIATWGYAGKRVSLDEDQINQVIKDLTPQRVVALLDTIENLDFEIKTNIENMIKDPNIEPNSKTNTWLRTADGQQFAQKYADSVELYLNLFKRYAEAEQENQGAVYYNDRIRGRIFLDAAIARVLNKVLAKASQIPGVLTESEKAQYEENLRTLEASLRGGAAVEKINKLDQAMMGDIKDLPSVKSGELKLEMVDNNIMQVTIDRQKTIPVNSISRQLMKDLIEIIHTNEHNEDVTGTVLTGAGQLAFVAGGDLIDVVRMNKEKNLPAAEEFVSLGIQLANAMDRSIKPVVAALNAYTLGAGSHLALAAHARVMARINKDHTGQKDVDNFLQHPEITLKAVPAWGALQRLPRLIGPKQAARIFLEPDENGYPKRLTAEEALDMGYVDQVVMPEDLQKAAIEKVRELKANPLKMRRNWDEIGEKQKEEALNLHNDLDVQEWVQAQTKLGRGAIAREILRLIQLGYEKNVEEGDKETILSAAQAFIAPEAREAIIKQVFSSRRNREYLALHGINIDDLADSAMRVEERLQQVNGGIDLNTSNGVQWKVSRDGRGVEMHIDPAMIERMKRDGVNWLSPVILKMTPVTSVWPLVGLQAPAKAERLAGV